MDWTNNIIISTIMDSHNKTDEEISATIKDAIEREFKRFDNEYCDNLYFLFSNSMYTCIHKMRALKNIDDDFKKRLDDFYQECKEHIDDEGFHWPWKELINLNRECRENDEKNRETEEQIRAEVEEHLMCFHNI